MTRAAAWSWAFIAVAATVLLTHAYVRYVPWSVIWVGTPSIPQGLYLAQPAAVDLLQRDSYACFSYEPPDWARARHYLPVAMPVCKQVRAVPGDRLRVAAGQVQRAEGKQWVSLGQLRTHDSRGRPVPGIAYDGPVPPHHYYFGSSHPQGLDSRYLGLVPLPRITKVLTPLWTETQHGA